MAETPMDRKIAAETRAKICRQEIAKLRDTINQIKPPKISVYKPNHGYLSDTDVQLVSNTALRAFLIQNLEAEALRYEREANRIRFEVIAWADEQRAAMQAEIAQFNAERLK